MDRMAWMIWTTVIVFTAATFTFVGLYVTGHTEPSMLLDAAKYAYVGSFLMFVALVLATLGMEALAPARPHPDA